MHKGYICSRVAPNGLNSVSQSGFKLKNAHFLAFPMMMACMMEIEINQEMLIASNIVQHHSDCYCLVTSSVMPGVVF